MKQHRLITLLLVLGATLLGPPSALAEEGAHAIHYYVSLGDSLAAGPGERAEKIGGTAIPRNS